jgi:hypothetical protein
MATYPIRVSDDRRHVVDRDGASYWIQGDTPWSLITAVSREQAERYLADRAGKGFNSLIVNLIEHKFNGPATRDGLLPFADPNDWTTALDAYFDHAEWVVARAARYGIQVYLAPIYLGYPTQADDEGWIREALANGVERCRAYGRYVGRRLGRHDNLVWLMGGDRNPGEARAHVDAVARGIQEQDGTRHLFTAHTQPECSPRDEYAAGGWLTLNATYTYGIVHRNLIADYRREPAMPTFLIESTYEGEHNASAVQIRRQAYWAALCGACGHFYGNYPMWNMDPGWEAALNARGAQDMAHLKALVDSRPWHTLLPDLEHAAVVAGLGEFRGLDYCAAARAADGSLIVAYLPRGRAITVNLEQLSGPAWAAWWFNPRTGEATPAGQTQRHGTRFSEFVPPGEGDWVLVVDDAVSELSPPGS